MVFCTWHGIVNWRTFDYPICFFFLFFFWGGIILTDQRRLWNVYFWNNNLMYLCQACDRHILLLFLRPGVWQRNDHNETFKSLLTFRIYFSAKLYEKSSFIWVLTNKNGMFRAERTFICVENFDVSIINATWFG